MRSVTIINQKGGCGKTTTAISLAGVFARRGLRTLLIDMDPQSHCAAGLAIPEQQFDLDISDALLADDLTKLDPARLVWRISRNLDLAPSRMRLAGLEASRGGLADKTHRERRLARVVEWLSGSYDICCIDCSPSIGLLTYNALIAATECLIPVETSYFSLQGATRQVQTIEALQKRLSISAPVWLLATIHDQDSPLAADLLQELRRLFGSRVAPQVIRQDMRAKEAASFGKPVCDYAPESPSALDYSALAEWLLSRQPGVGPPSNTDPEPGAPDAHESPSATMAEIRAGAHRTFVEPGEPAESATREPSWPASPDQPADLPAADAALLPNRADDVASLAARVASQPSAASRGLATAPAPASLTEAKPAAPVHPAADPAFAAPGALPIVSEAERIIAVNPGASGYGAHSVPGGVVFIQPLSAGASVTVAAEIGSAMSEYPMRRNERAGIHELRLAIPAGSCYYRLIVDGWPSVDPFNRMVEMNPFGAPMSVAFAAAPPAGSER
jgi:chromosome partitioning protein